MAACHGGAIRAEPIVPTDGAAAAGADRLERVPGRGTRLFVAGFLAVVLGSGLVGLEAWPLTGWKLYSRLRSADFWGWQVLAVDPDGTERHVDLREAPAAYHGVTHLLQGFEGLSDEEREAACLGLAEVARRQYPDAAGVAVDHVLGRVPVDRYGPPAPPSRRVRMHECRLG